MGKKAKQRFKAATKIKFDKKTLGNLGKNILGAGAVGAALTGAPGAAALLGVAAQAWKKSNTGGGGGGGGGGGEEGGIQSTAQKYEQALEQQRLKNVEVGGQLTEQMRKQAMGEAPSLAEAQLKSAQTRNLAQTLAAAQGAGASPLATRQMLQTRGQQGRELAETGTQMALQERQAAQAALGGQLASQAGIVRSDIESGFGIAKTPAQMAQERQLAQAQIQAQRDAAKQQAQSQMLGSLISGGATVGAAMLSDKIEKENIKPAEKQVKSFLDALEARQYEYKDASLPGAAEGTRYGIMAQDLEKSSLGKTLVKNTPNGKMVDTVQGFGAVLAAQAELNRRLKKLEKKGK